MPDSRPTPSDDAGAPHSALVWLRRLGVAGFLIFLCMGLLWLTPPALLVTLDVRR